MSDTHVAEFIEYKDIHQGETCYIIGNGRSLEQVDLPHLNNYVTYGGNYILDAYTPTYHVVFDVEVAKDWDWITERQNGTTTFLYKNYALYKDNAIPIDWTDIRYPNDKSCQGNITTIALMLAYYMGCTTAYMIGMDWGTPRLHHRGMLPYTTVEQNRPPSPPPHVVDRHTHDLRIALSAWHAAGRTLLNITPHSLMPIIPPHHPLTRTHHE